LETSLKTIIEWNKAFLKNENMRQVCLDEIEKYFGTNPWILK
jgi:hypothetical protein